MSEAELIERLGRLEQDNRRLKRGGMVGLALAVAIAAVAARSVIPPNTHPTPPIPNVIEAHEFEIVDATGKLRGRMSAYTPHRAGIQFYDALGKTRAEMSISSGKPLIALSDTRGNSLAFMTISSSGRAYIAVGPTSGGVDMEASASGQPLIQLYDARGVGIKMEVRNASAAPSAMQRVSAPSIVIFGNENEKERRVIWRAP